MRAGKREMKKLKAMALARIENAKRRASRIKKTTTLYIGMPAKPMNDCSFDQSTACSIMGSDLRRSKRLFFSFFAIKKRSNLFHHIFWSRHYIHGFRIYKTKHHFTQGRQLFVLIVQLKVKNNAFRARQLLE